MTGEELHAKFDEAKRRLRWDKALKIIRSECIRSEYAIAAIPVSITLEKLPTELRTPFMAPQQLYDTIQGAIYQQELRFYDKKTRKKFSTTINPILKNQ